MNSILFTDCWLFHAKIWYYLIWCVRYRNSNFTFQELVKYVYTCLKRSCYTGRLILAIATYISCGGGEKKAYLVHGLIPLPASSKLELFISYLTCPACLKIELRRRWDRTLRLLPKQRSMFGEYLMNHTRKTLLK